MPAPTDKTMVGLPTPRAFAISFARDGDARASAPSVCAAWSIAEVQALEDPVPAPTDKTMVGLPTPRAFAVSLARDCDARAFAPSVCASVVSPALAARQGCSGSCCAAFFEKQVGCWCGKHALNNYMGGPYITEAACRAAARLLTHVEDRAFHLDPRSGWLSVEVMNVLGAGQLGAHLDESPKLIKSDPLGRPYLAQ